MSNRNAEGYLELTPIMNVTGGKAASGAQNWHVPLYPARLESLGIAVADKGGPAHRLLGALFPNDVPQLQPTGRMRPMVLGAVAGVLCAYSKLVSDFDDKDGTIIKIKEAAKAAAIDDQSVPKGTGPRWNVVLRSWSRKIEDDFKHRNISCVFDDAELAGQQPSARYCKHSNRKSLIWKDVDHTLPAIQSIIPPPEISVHLGSKDLISRSSWRKVMMQGSAS